MGHRAFLRAGSIFGLGLGLATRLNPRHASYCRTRTGRRATGAAHGDPLLVLSSTRISCQGHRRAR
eukprot:1081446-Prymnesium_polylepis.1